MKQSIDLLREKFEVLIEILEENSKEEEPNED